MAVAGHSLAGVVLSWVVGIFGIGVLSLIGMVLPPALLVRTGAEAFDILVFTTYALDQLHTLEDAALEYGVSVTR